MSIRIEQLCCALCALFAQKLDKRDFNKNKICEKTIDKKNDLVYYGNN